MLAAFHALWHNHSGVVDKLSRLVRLSSNILRIVSTSVASAAGRNQQKNPSGTPPSSITPTVTDFGATVQVPHQSDAVNRWGLESYICRAFPMKMSQSPLVFLVLLFYPVSELPRNS